MGFQFDLPNFGAGVVAGVAGSIAAYRINNAIQKWRRERQYRPQRRRVKGSVEGNSNYNRFLIEMAQSGHLLGHRVPLSQLLIEPRFIRPADFVSMPDEDEPTPVFDEVPRVHDYPYLHAAYNLPTLSMDDLSRSDNTILMVGQPGSGRTTALFTIAMWSLGAVEFETPTDPVQQQIDEEEQKLSQDEQAERVRQRVALFEQGRQQFAQSREGVEEDDLINPTEERTSRFRLAAPLYVHLCDVLSELDDANQQIDPAEPLMRALQHQVGWLTAKSMVSQQYELLQEGDAIVLIDGYDDVPHDQRDAVRAWLRTFSTMYDDNFIIIAAPPEGYQMLADEDAVAVYLRPWNDQMISDYVDKWINNWDAITGSETIPLIRAAADETPEGDLTPDARTRLLDDLKKELRLLSPHDLTLTLWQRLQNHDEFNESDLIQAYLSDLFSEAETILPELMRMAAMQHDYGFIRLQRLVDDLVMEEMERLGFEDYYTGSNGASPATATSNQSDDAVADDADEDDWLEDDHTPVQDDDDSEEDIFSTLEDVPVAAAPQTNTTSSDDTASNNGSVPDDDEMDEKDIEKKEKQLRRDIRKQQSKLLETLVEADVLVPYRDDRYQFRYAALAQYIAARAVAEVDDDLLFEMYDDADWRRVIPFLSQQRDIDPLVAEQLSQPLDVLHTNLLELATWLRYAGTDAPWRNNLLKYLGNLMVVPHQYTLIRNRIAAALVSARDEGTLVIFRRALDQENPDVQKVGCLGVGTLRDDRSLDKLYNIALGSQYDDVAIAAALAIGAIGSEDALYTMIDVLRDTNNKGVRRAIAETLAGDREQGYLTLYDALKSDDLMLRRAAVFGLSRVDADWALIALNETFLEDNEPYVRLAVEVVFQEIYEASLRGANPYPAPQDAPWLQEWAQENIERGNIAHNLEGVALFEAALENDFDPLARMLAIATVGQTATIEYLDEIYTALRDPQEAIRDTAYQALGQFQEKLGEHLPAPQTQSVSQQTA